MDQDIVSVFDDYEFEYFSGLLPVRGRGTQALHRVVALLYRLFHAGTKNKRWTIVWSHLV